LREDALHNQGSRSFTIQPEIECCGKKKVETGKKESYFFGHKNFCGLGGLSE